jgi:hypothetical protein
MFGAQLNATNLLRYATNECLSNLINREDMATKCAILRPHN